MEAWQHKGQTRPADEQIMRGERTLTLPDATYEEMKAGPLHNKVKNHRHFPALTSEDIAILEAESGDGYAADEIGLFVSRLQDEAGTH